MLIRKLSYVVSSEEWGNECGWVCQHNLLFEYLRNVYPRPSSGGGCGSDDDANVSDDFISVQFGDTHSPHHRHEHGNERQRHRYEHSNISPTLRSYYYQADVIRERMLRNGLKSPNGDEFQLLGCSNSQVRNYSFLFRRVSPPNPNNNTLTASKNKKKSRKSVRVSTNSYFHRLQHFTNEELLASLLPKLIQLEEKKGVSK